MTLLIVRFLTCAQTNFKPPRLVRQVALSPDVFVVRFYVGVKNGFASKDCTPSHEQLLDGFNTTVICEVPYKKFDPSNIFRAPRRLPAGKFDPSNFFCGDAV